jgi:hypothetical protein
MQRPLIRRGWVFAIWSITMALAVLGGFNSVPAAAECNGNTALCTVSTCTGQIYCVGSGYVWNPCSCYQQPSCEITCSGGTWIR